MRIKSERVKEMMCASKVGGVDQTAVAVPEPCMPMFEIEGEPQEAREARRLVLEAFKDLEFYEEEHKYLLHGKALSSISGLAHRFESKPFDADVQAVLYARRHGETAEYWKAQWECNAFKATSLGTKTHEFGESLAYLKAGHPEFIRDSVKPQYNKKHHYLAPIHPKEEAVEQFLADLPSCYHLVLNEARVYSGKNPDPAKNLKEQICGTFDMLYWYDGEGDAEKAGFVVFDYKTNSSLEDVYNRQHFVMLKTPFSHLYQENLSAYTIQLGLYSLLLQDIGINVIGRQLVWAKNDGTYELVPLPDITNELRKAF